MSGMVIPGRLEESGRVGKAKRAHHGKVIAEKMVGTAQERLCPPYES
ncbi:hypothetical protein ACVIWV_004867 [Bradyrhizobium diazoefficiens]